jgi:hypothetical protein
VSEPETRALITQRVNYFCPGDVKTVLRERGWLAGETSADTQAWLERAAQLLGPQCETKARLAELLERVFLYDARELLRQPGTHAVLTRKGARAVLRELATLVLEGGAVDSDRLKEIINTLKERLPYRARELFHTLRLVLAGRVGEGELDRVILLLDWAAGLPFAVKVKSCRERIIEFCSEME